MSVENGKVCCNCHHCIREWTDGYCRIREWTDGYCRCRCEVSGEYLGYVRVMEGWCRHWSRERRTDEQTRD